MADQNLQALFAHTLKDVYFAENAILKELPKMAQAASSKALKEAFERHRAETEGQVRRLEKIFSMLGQKPEGVKCHAIEGLAEEAHEITEEFEGGALDAGLIGAAQAVEHYEIARYGTLRAWAEQLGMEDAARLLSETLDEEESTDQLLSELAEDVINPKAA
jgi:ferritin-like metal-binding protein YciE